MPPIRFIVQSNPGDGEQRLPALARYAASARLEPGCVQFEDFRSISEPASLLHLELWESAEAWDQHWDRLIEGAGSSGGDALLELLSLAEPTLGGVEPAPRGFGQNGIELYEQRFYAHSDGVWFPATGSRPDSVRWPAWAPVRIVVQGTSDPASDPTRQIQSALRRREYPGCDHFEHYRGTEYPENTVLMETWATPKIYDDFWHYLQTEQSTNPFGGARPIPARRRYGIAGNEWHNLCYYTIVDGVWQPKDPALRSTVVRW